MIELKTRTLVLILILVVALGGIGAVQYFNQPDIPDDNTQDTTDTGTSTEPTTPDITPTEDETTTEPAEPYDGGPIIIQGNAAFTTTNGVVSGSGTEADPYIIEGWDIDLSKCDTSVWPYIRVGIAVYDTTAYYVIRDCQVDDDETHVGIYLQSTSGVVEDCYVANSYTGISMTDVYDVTLIGNTVESCEDGIGGGSRSSVNVNILNNTITDCTDFGLDFFNLHRSTAIGNIIQGCNMGMRIDTSTNSTISANSITGNTYEGIDLSYSGWEKDLNTLSFNAVSNNGGTGISVYGSFCTITGNTVVGNGEMGIRVDFIGLTDVSGCDNLISGNIVSGNIGSGIYVGYNCVRNTLSYNICTGNNANNEQYFDGTPKAYDLELWASQNTLQENTYGTIYVDAP
ncbi:MAG: right-handed parallel beta-helix repeat-containing protein [Candidatus Bathyarchaeota archaeon]|nr:right-handed parallel beta-helix repeat-containing protein [Candidatus Bathyarchaeota archaeon]